MHSKRETLAQLNEELDVCRCMIDHARALKRDYPSTLAQLNEQIRTLIDERNKLSQQYADADHTIEYYKRRRDSAEARLVALDEDRRPRGFSTRTHLSPLERKKRELARLREKIATLENSIEEES